MSMTETTWPEPIPGFSVLKMKEEIQSQILRETEGMTDEEVRAYFRKGSEEFQRETAEYRAKRQRKTATQ